MHGSYAPVRTVAPAQTPVTLAEAKAHCRVDHSDEDSLITSLIGAAVAELDGWAGSLGRCLVTQTWAQDFDGFPLRLRLPLPAATIVSVTYVDTDGSAQTLAEDRYELRRDALGSFVEPAFSYSWPAVRAQSASVTVTFTAGASAADVPASIKTAILLRVADLYQNREAVGAELKPSPTIRALLAPFTAAGL
ncbi:MAG: head-tail connector protein [Brevundimonas sp.]|uniref:head-tail connector protein n=1 Tax=Brevundimonas sp. TaxID=1871086 RepID=UPI0040336033